jgi:hypothetical protein
MRGILFLAVLNVKSSYSRELELSLESPDDIPDTLQWWFGGSGCWRIRTHALDPDIHAYQVGNSPQTTLGLAKRNNQKNYGDVIAAQHLIHFADCTNRGELEAEFGRIGFVPRLEVDDNHRFAFWKPDDAVYSTKSSPKKRSSNLP